MAIRQAPAGGGATTTRYQHTDALGSPIAVSDESGAVIQTSEYEPYGQLLNRPLADGPGFTGHVQDAATGLTYMQQRYYDPGIGRNLSVDPVTAYDSGDYRYFNRYAYAFNNPYKFTDPDGRCPSCAGAAIGAGLDFVIQVAEIGMGTRTEIDGTSILISAGTGALGVGLAGKVGRIGGILVDAAISAGSTAAKGEEVTVGGVVADVAFGRAGGAAAEKAIVKTAEHKIAQRQANRLERIGNKPGARNAQQTRAQNAGPALQRSTEQRAAQAGVVSAGVGSAAEKQVERRIDEDKNR
ncbi:RHS repeat-associated core domain-containing protein [Rhodoferax sp.]|uniref:RHS repeat-associated core domain-containing protein n=1 Tax=Rhodoferax sp. TaxID=50421 RepID=UPI003BB713AF